MLQFFWGSLTSEMCWLWSNRKSNLWCGEQLKASQLEAKLLARLSAAEFVSAQQAAAADVWLVLKAVGFWGLWGASRAACTGKPRVHPHHAGKSPLLTLTSKSAYLLQKAHAQGARNSCTCKRCRARVGCYRRWCFHSSSGAEYPFYAPHLLDTQTAPKILHK